MRLAREKGFKMSHIRRVGRDIKEFDLRYWFARSGTSYLDILKAKKPVFEKEIEVILDPLKLRDERNRKARENYERRKEAQKEPIEYLEGLRSLVSMKRMNTKERNDALAAAGFN